jgi:hypothetical protein
MVAICAAEVVVADQEVAVAAAELLDRDADLAADPEGFWCDAAAAEDDAVELDSEQTEVVAHRALRDVDATSDLRGAARRASWRLSCVFSRPSPAAIPGARFASALAPPLDSAA